MNNLIKDDQSCSIRTDGGWRYTEYMFMKVITDYRSFRKKNNYLNFRVVVLRAGVNVYQDHNESLQNNLKGENGFEPIDQEPDWDNPADHPELYNLNK